MDVRNGLTIRSQDAAWPRRAFLLCSGRRGWLRGTTSNKGERRRESPTAAPVTGVRGRLFSAKIDDEEDRRIKVPTASFAYGHGRMVPCGRRRRFEEVNNVCVGVSG
jgi:hypothetical protein